MAAAAGAAPLLAQRRDGAGEADRDRAVEQADVDPELERVGCGHPEQLALDEAPLDLAALLGRVAGAVGSEPRPRARSRPAREAKRWTSSTALRLFAKQIVRCPRPTRSASRRDASPSALARIPSSSSTSGGFQSAIVRSARGAPSSSITVASTPSERVRPALPGWRSWPRHEQELRLGAVDAGQPLAAAAARWRRASRRRRGRACASSTTTYCRFVEHVAPAVVVREDADVEHVRVGQDHVGRLADLPAPLGAACRRRRSRARSLGRP